MYKDIEELRKEIKGFREKIADSSVLADTIRKNDAEIQWLKQELEQQKRDSDAVIAQLKNALAEQKRNAMQLRMSIDDHKDQIRKYAHPWRRK